MNDLTIIIPAKNESESLPLVLEKLEKLNVKILISLKKNDILTIKSFLSINFSISSSLDFMLSS